MICQQIDENERKSTDSSQNRDSKPISSSRREFDKSDGALGDREHSIEPDSSSRKNKSRDRTPTTTKDRYYSVGHLTIREFEKSKTLFCR